MSSFPILDLVVGMIFIYFLLSIICSSAVELWFSLRKTRAKILEEWLVTIFNSPALDPNGQAKAGQATVGQAIMDHCITTALSKKNSSTTYIDPENFVSALLDQITLVKKDKGVDDGQVQMPPQDLNGYITAIQNSTAISGELKRSFLSFAYQAQAATSLLQNIPAVANVAATIKSDIDQFRERLEHWYDTTSERLTSAMKRKKVMPATFIGGLVLTIALNADSVAISRYLYSHPEESKKFADKAMNDFQNFRTRVDSLDKKVNKSDTTRPNKAELMAKTEKLEKDITLRTNAVPPALPLGWNGESHRFKDGFLTGLGASIATHWIGWSASILAICLGAPFWFDILNKIANLRSTGPKPSTADPKNAS